MDINYKLKYLIYKQKYKDLKQLISDQTGGVICSDCGKSVGSYDELIEHKRRQHNTGLTLIEHRRKQNAEAAKRRRDSVRFGNKGIKCDYCNLRFYDNSYLSTHMIRDHTQLLNSDNLSFINLHIRKPIPEIYATYINQLQIKFGKSPVIIQKFPFPLKPSPQPPLPSRSITSVEPTNQSLPVRSPSPYRQSPVRRQSPIRPPSPYRQSPIRSPSPYRQSPIRPPSPYRQSPIRPPSPVRIPSISYEDRLQFPSIDNLMVYPSESNLDYNNEQSILESRLEDELNLWNKDSTLTEELNELDKLLFTY
jgi:hypothetical protein